MSVDLSERDNLQDPNPALVSNLQVSLPGCLYESFRDTFEETRKRRTPE